VRSPYVGVCDLTDDGLHRRGCLRTLDEIAEWLRYSDAQREQVLDAVAARSVASAMPQADTETFLDRDFASRSSRPHTSSKSSGAPSRRRDGATTRWRGVATG